MGTHPGVVEQACYFIEKGNVIVLCHRDGTATCVRLEHADVASLHR